MTKKTLLDWTNEFKDNMKRAQRRERVARLMGHDDGTDFAYKDGFHDGQMVNDWQPAKWDDAACKEAYERGYREGQAWNRGFDDGYDSRPRRPLYDDAKSNNSYHRGYTKGKVARMNGSDT